MADITIRRVRTSDAEGFAELMANPDVYGGLLQLPYPSVEGWRTRLTEWDAPGRYDLMLVADADGRIVGSAGLHPASPSLRRRHAWMLGVSVAKDRQRQGIGARLMAALLDAADRWLGCLRVELTVYTDNVAAIAVSQVRLRTRRHAPRLCAARRPLRRHPCNGAVAPRPTAHRALKRWRGLHRHARP